MRVTRAAAAKQAGLVDGVGEENKPQELGTFEFEPDIKDDFKDGK